MARFIALSHSDCYLRQDFKMDLVVCLLSFNPLLQSLMTVYQSAGLSNCSEKIAFGRSLTLAGKPCLWSFPQCHNELLEGK